jgi:hypothetical protein
MFKRRRSVNCAEKDLLPEFTIADLIQIGLLGGVFSTLLYQIKTIRADTYEKLRSDHHELIRLEVSEKELLHEMLQHNPTSAHKKLHELSPDELKLLHFYVLEFDLYERIYMAKRKHWGLIKEDEWEMWLKWLDPISHHWLFKYTYDQFYEIYEPGMMVAIRERYGFPERESETPENS